MKPSSCDNEHHSNFIVVRHEINEATIVDSAHTKEIAIKLAIDYSNKSNRHYVVYGVVGAALAVPPVPQPSIWHDIKKTYKIT